MKFGTHGLLDVQTYFGPNIRKNVNFLVEHRGPSRTSRCLLITGTVYGGDHLRIRPRIVIKGLGLVLKLVIKGPIICINPYIPLLIICI